MNVVDEGDEKEQGHRLALDLGKMEGATNNSEEEMEEALPLHAWMMNMEWGHLIGRLGKKVD